jgi:hypothetical protein
VRTFVLEIFIPYTVENKTPKMDIDPNGRLARRR